VCQTIMKSLSIVLFKVLQQFKFELNFICQAERKPDAEGFISNLVVFINSAKFYYLFVLFLVCYF